MAPGLGYSEFCSTNCYVAGDMTVELRTATITATAIVALDHVGASDPARVRFIHHQIQSSALHVAVIDARVVAYAVLNYKCYDNGWIEMLYVDPRLRRRGIGSALIRHLINECRTSKLFTSTNQSNFPMQRLLATLEFDRSGFIENLDDGDPEWVYFKRLRDHATQPAHAPEPPM